MNALFEVERTPPPAPARSRIVFCRNPVCRRPVQADRAVQGYGEHCARERGLLGSTVDVGQDGPDLLDVLAETMRAAD